MDRLDQFRVFVRVVECASYTRAADQLGLPRSTVSAAVQALEARLGVRLLNRTTRRVSPTLDGQVFHGRCLRLIEEVEEAEGLFRASTGALHGVLKIDVPGRIGRRIVAPALPEFLDAHPDLRVELGVSDRTIDLVAEGVDCALRVGPLADSSLVARSVGRLELINVASPAYLARRGEPRSPEMLERHDVVQYASPSTGRVEPWEWVEDGRVRTLATAGRVTVNSAEAYIACCLAGLGLIQIPAFDVRDHLEQGDLQVVMDDFRAAPMPMWLVQPARRLSPRRVDAFADWLIDRLRRSLSPEGVS